MGARKAKPWLWVAGAAGLLLAGVLVARPRGQDVVSPAARPGAPAPKPPLPSTEGISEAEERAAHDAYIEKLIRREADRETILNNSYVKARQEAPYRTEPAPLWPLNPRQAEGLRRVVLDPGRMAVDRIGSWKQLQMGRQLTPEVNAALIEVFHHAPDMHSRRLAAILLGGERSDDVRTALIVSLQKDQDVQVREASAQSLAILAVNDPLAGNALRQAAETDPALSVRTIAPLGLR